MTKLTQELQPAYERPIDPESVDARMKSHIEWEDSGRVTPRTRFELDVSKHIPVSEKAKKLRKVLALGSLVVVVGAGAVGLIGRAMDQDSNPQPHPDDPAYLHKS